MTWTTNEVLLIFALGFCAGICLTTILSSRSRTIDKGSR